MKTLLDLENWNRKEHFAHFIQMEEPFFGATVEIDCTQAYETAKSLESSFFIYYLHKTLVAVNAIENFRYRISGDQIYINDQIDASATIGREDGTFGFSFIEYHPDFKTFEKTALQEIERIQNTTGLFTRSFENDNLIHFSAIPWLNFTSLSHARSFTFPDSCPKVSFGKMMVSPTGKRTIAMSVHVHHALMDGLHMGQFVDYFQELMNQ
ncbi:MULTISPECIES: chloramphenicol acetyltransferase [Flavobacterium]|uniref:Chloramphenicol acetyltransferase n=2 Tax=Flavobacterium TaxID=237 RepID=A0A1S1JB19_9FLAO|nr:MULTISPECIES: chloramphenicol acetyltransferase [Flavobacterium]MCC9017647.1 chloramphenicol acetyltransferase [Flavobacterium sp. F-126]OHT46635.1 chloramphenicol acetyltransferase [Flavobacterium tructae]OXB20946.1 chloramphenicol acetyltransferase [Flavobacterium tructae]OXB25406.1 chloramphenicol acetyltransferase [Flavobacterium tructae]URC13566.1 chloramphenicol acetyltransferase [Flavobacterium sp. B183]